MDASPTEIPEEPKFQDAPRVTPSMRIALSDLRLDHLTVLYPGNRTYARAPDHPIFRKGHLPANPTCLFQLTPGVVEQAAVLRIRVGERLADDLPVSRRFGDPPRLCVEHG
jgi:hypothetical protein